MNEPDAAAAICWAERARAALNLAAQSRAYADAFVEIPDPAGDTWHGEMRREVYRHALAIADAQEVYADRCREAAHDAQQLRRHRYDVEHYTDLARQAQGGAA